MAATYTALRRRRHQRGAAMVEAAFMFPMFIIMFFSLIYAHSFGATKIAEQTQAREMAWTNAMANCGNTGDGGGDSLPDTVNSLSLKRGNFVGVSNTSSIAMTTTSSPQDPMNGAANGGQAGVSKALQGGSIEGAFSGIAGMVLNVVAEIFPTPTGAQGVSTGTVSWRLPNNYAKTDPSNSTLLTQKVTVYCNEKPQNGSVKTVVEDLIGSIVGFVEGAL